MDFTVGGKAHKSPIRTSTFLICKEAIETKKGLFVVIGGASNEVENIRKFKMHEKLPFEL